MTAMSIRRQRVGSVEGALVAAALLLSCCWAQSCHAWMSSTGPLRIDCGSQQTLTDAQGLVWHGDQFYSNGSARTIQPIYDAGGLLSAVDSTLRSWDSGDSCYRIPIAPGRYLVRLSFAYNNFDGNYYNLLPTNELPAQGVSINGFYVEAISVEGINLQGYYTDYIAFSSNPTLDVCLLASQSSPYINSIQVLPMDTEAYFSSVTGSDVVLSNWVRMSCGGAAFGPETNGDSGYRTWEADMAPSDSDPYVKVSTSSPISIPSTWDAFHLPQTLFQTARKAGSASLTTGFNFTNIFPVSPTNKFMVVLYFAEIEGAAVGERVMDVWVNGQWIYGVDIVERAGGSNTALLLSLPQVQLGGDPSSPLGQWIGVLLFPAGGGKAGYKAPMISGIEIYETIFGATAVPATPDTVQVRIDCGGQYNFTDSYDLQWMADSGFASSGMPGIVVDPGNDLQHAHSLRYFSIPKKNCYEVAVPSALYLVRMFFDYGNYDQQDTTPTFDVALESTFLVKVTPSTPGGFIDAIVLVDDGMADVCLMAPADGPPSLITALEIIQINSSAYGLDYFGQGVLFFDYFRITAGGHDFGEGISRNIDNGHRQWLGDQKNISDVSVTCFPLCTSLFLPPSVITIENADVAPNFFPFALYRTARSVTGGGLMNSSITYDFTNLDDAADLALYLHFAEISPDVKKGERIFSVFVNGKPVDGAQNIDLLSSYGLNAAFDTQYFFSLPEGSNSVRVELIADPSALYGPLISGLELYRALQMGPKCQPATVGAMKALRSSMAVPEKYSWQGDPCGGVAWTGVSCELDFTKSFFTITSISLPYADLNGSLPDEIGVLTDLTSLDLSHNFISGPIPESITLLKQITSIDLSLNRLNGSIPEGMASMQSLHLLLLNNNSLMGVPKNLAPPPGGLTVNLDGNTYLCGADGFPSCDSIIFPPPPGGYSSIAIPTAAPPSSKSSSTTAIIVGVTLGILALMAVGAVAWLLLMRRRRALLSDSELIEGEPIQTVR